MLCYSKYIELRFRSFNWPIVHVLQKQRRIIYSEAFVFQWDWLKKENIDSTVWKNKVQSIVLDTWKKHRNYKVNLLGQNKLIYGIDGLLRFYIVKKHHLHPLLFFIISPRGSHLEEHSYAYESVLLNKWLFP